MIGGYLDTQIEDSQSLAPKVELEEVESLRILIADDNDSDRLILQTIVKRQGHVVYPAADGVQAVEIYEKESPDIVLLDALMPNMDGFEAARRIKALAGEDLVPIIFLTSLKDATSLAECLAAGGSDFLSKPYNRIILQAKIKAFARMRKLHETVQAQRDEIAQHHDHLVHEQEVAKAVFDNIAHPGCVAAENIKCLISPMAVFNGDMVLAARKPSGGMLVLLGDFTGHGLPAAIGAMPASEIFYGMTQKGFSLNEILREINKKLKAILPVGVFCCTCMVDLSFRNEMMEVWVGGLPDLYLYRSKSREIVKIASKNLPLGVLGDERFDSSTEVFEMSHGDRLYLWSDGIHEAPNSKGQMFGTDGIDRVFSNNQNPENLFDDILKAVDDFTDGGEQDDDHTMVELKMVAEEDLQQATPKTEKSGIYAGPMDWRMQYELRPQTLKSFNPLPLITHILMEVPGLRTHSGKLYTILSELYSNALEHGIMGLDSELKSSPTGFAEYYQKRTERLETLDDGLIMILLEHLPSENGGSLKIRIEDTGPGFDYKKNLKNDHKTIGYSGRGIPLIKSMCSRFEYLENGNIVEATFDWTFT